jgi:hypothetical protein
MSYTLEKISVDQIEAVIVPGKINDLEFFSRSIDVWTS